LVFASAVGTPLDAANLRREFRKITEAAGLGAGWAPLDLRHTLVSLMSADGVPIEEIARLAGHNRAAAELVALLFDTHNITAGCGDRFPDGQQAGNRSSEHSFGNFGSCLALC
jgi:integrase